MLSRGKIALSFKNTAHHIIMPNAKGFRMIELREMLEKFGFNYNEHIQ